MRFKKNHILVIGILTVQEKRQHKRFIVEGLDIQAKTIFSTEVNILDISLGGACISGTKRLNIGNEYTLKIEGRDSTISLSCIVVWEKLSGNRKTQSGEIVPVYRVGMQFKEGLTQKLNEVLDFIKENSIIKENKLKGIRFKIHPGKAVINYPKVYAVKKISMGGILMVADEPLPVEENFHMEISIPDEEPIHFLGRVASCIEIPDMVAKCYDIGIAFFEILDNDRSRLSAFIDLLRDSEQV
ncbi:MAG: hypothetical protein OHK0032_14400 [Thermodesulfovibrionales bacterium]